MEIRTLLLKVARCDNATLMVNLRPSIILASDMLEMRSEVQGMVIYSGYITLVQATRWRLGCTEHYRVVRLVKKFAEV